MRRLGTLLAMFAFCLGLLPGGNGYARALGTTTDLPSIVWGQPNFVSGICRRATALTLCGPAQAVPDSEGNLWVADFANNRVVMYPPGGTKATKVLGQYGSFATTGCNRHPKPGRGYPPAPNRYTLCQPIGVAVDSSGTLYVADALNNRIMIYYHAARKPPAAPADRVLGQPGFHATASNDGPRYGTGPSSCPAPHPASRCTLNGPMELSIDSHGDLLVPDFDNNRVLLWSAVSLVRLKSSDCAVRCAIPASRVWGQYGSYATTQADNPHVPGGLAGVCTPIETYTHPDNACTLSGPWRAVIDDQGNLFVSDTDNSRVLEYSQALTTVRQDASAVYGQNGQLDTANGNLGGISAVSLWHPVGLALDPTGNLWVTDFYNKRVLEFPPPGSGNAESAIRVLGQQGRFDTNSCGADEQSLCGPTGVSFDQAGDVYVVDGLDSRVLEYQIAHQ